jgi:hypothetical protein
MTSELVTQDVPQSKDSFDIYFEVSLPPDGAWPVLWNIPHLVPYIPQVTLTENSPNGHSNDTCGRSDERHPIHLPPTIVTLARQAQHTTFPVAQGDQPCSVMIRA